MVPSPSEPVPAVVVGNLSLDDPAEPFTRRSWRYRARMALRSARELIGDDPFFLPVVLRATPTGTVRRLTDRTELVIEGYPRSGNTFAFFAVRRAAGDGIVLSSHVHTPSAVKAATALRIPTLLVVREPRAAVISLLIAAPHVPFHRAILEWTHHHREVWPYRDRFVTATFEQVTQDLGEVTRRVNERFGTSFPCFDPTPDNVEAVFAAIEHNHQVLHGGTENVVPRPSAARRAEREWLEEQLAAPHLSALLDEAAAVYAGYEALASR